MQKDSKHLFLPISHLSLSSQKKIKRFLTRIEHKKARGTDGQTILEMQLKNLDICSQL